MGNGFVGGVGPADWPNLAVKPRGGPPDYMGWSSSLSEGGRPGVAVRSFLERRGVFVGTQRGCLYVCVCGGGGDLVKLA